MTQKYLRGLPRDEEDRKRAAELAARIGLPYDDLSTFGATPSCSARSPWTSWSATSSCRSGAAGRRGRRRDGGSRPTCWRWTRSSSRSARRSRSGSGRRGRIAEILEKSESTQRVLDEATEDFKIQLVQERENGEEALSIESITADTSPIIKLVDTIVFNAIQRRASRHPRRDARDTR